MASVIYGLTVLGADSEVRLPVGVDLETVNQDFFLIVSGDQDDAASEHRAVLCIFRYGGIEGETLSSAVREVPGLSYVRKSGYDTAVVNSYRIRSCEGLLATSAGQHEFYVYFEALRVQALLY